MVSLPKIPRGEAHFGPSFRALNVADWSVHAFAPGLAAADGVLRKLRRWYMASCRPWIHILPHQRASSPATRAPAQARQRAAAQEACPARPQPIPIRNPTRAPRIINDFIYLGVCSAEPLPAGIV